MPRFIENSLPCAPICKKIGKESVSKLDPK
jgi:hypothetical protein